MSEFEGPPTIWEMARSVARELEETRARLADLRGRIAKTHAALVAAERACIDLVRGPR